MNRRVTVVDAQLETPAKQHETALFCPHSRPPMALLTVLDDGSIDSGETWRLRGPRHIIGRTQGQILIAHDAEMSGEHAEIVCAATKWSLGDLKSKNGTFFRVNRTVLRDGSELLLGATRFVFHQDSEPKANTPDRREVTRTVRAPHESDSASVARLVRHDGQGKPLVLNGKLLSLGCDAKQCQLSIADDPCINPHHATIRRDSKGRWVIQDLDSVNGVWLRVDRVTLDDSSEFQLGEQRFRFRRLPLTK